MDDLPQLETTNGITVMASTSIRADYGAMRTLIESGVGYRDVAEHFKIGEGYIRRKAKEEGWLRPCDVEKMRKEIATKQGETLRRSGKAADVASVKAQIWTERGEKIKERTYELVMASLDGVTNEQAKRFIKNPLGLMHTTQVARLITGEEKAENDQPRLAVNISMLRSQQPVDIIVDAEEA